MDNIPHRGVIWHTKQKSWRVKVKKMDHSVTPSRDRYFYKEFSDLETAVRVRDYVARMIHGSNAKLNLDGRLPPQVNRVNIIQWLITQKTIGPEEVPEFIGRVTHLDRPTLS